MKEWVRSLEFGIEECILASIIILNIFDAFELLPPDLDYIKKIISWSALAVMFVHARIDRVIAGQRNSRAATALLIGFFLLTIKNLVEYSISSYSEASAFLEPLYSSIIAHAATIQVIGLFLGCCFIIYGSIRLGMKGIKKPSLGYALTHKEFPPGLAASLWSLLFSFLFFIGVFNIAMEWLAIAIDAPLLMIGIAFFLFHVYRTHKFQAQTKLLSYFGSFGLEWYEKIIKELKHRKYILRVAAIIVCLYGVTDALVFLWPVLFGSADPLYLAQLPYTHPSLWSLALSAVTPLFDNMVRVLIYLANVWAVGFILIFPAYLWRERERNKEVILSPQLLAITLASFLIVILAPGFEFAILSSGTIFGMNLSFFPLSSGVLPLFDYLLLAGAVALLVAWQVHRRRKQELAQTSIVVITMTAFSLYVLGYLTSIALYYMHSFGVLRLELPLLLPLFLLFFLCSVTIVLTGLVGLWKLAWWHIHKHHHRYKTTRR